MASEILSPSDIVRQGERIELFLSGNTPLVAGPSVTSIRELIDSNAEAIGVESFFGDELALRGGLSLFTWYEIHVEINKEQSVSQIQANVASVVDSGTSLYWNVHVSEVRRPRSSVEECLKNPIACVTPEVPTSTAITIVAMAAIVVGIVILLN